MQYFKHTLEIIAEACNSIDEKTYEILLNDCEAVLQNKGKIIASGLGKNVPICEKFEGTMNSFGMDARFLHTNTAMHGDLGIVKDEDLVILLSKSGNTAETLTLAQQLEKRKCKVWAITFGQNAKVCEVVDNSLIIYLRHEGDEWNVVPNNSTTVYLIILQAIAVKLAQRFHISREQFGKNHPGGAIGESLRTK